MNDNQLNGSEDFIANAINTAEDVLDPLERLIEKTSFNAGSPFAPEVLVELAALRDKDREAFEKLRAQLKKVGDSA